MRRRRNFLLPRRSGMGSRHHLINLLHHWTFSLKVYCYHKSVFARWSIVRAHDFPKSDLIASIQLSRLIWNSFRRGRAVALQMNPWPSQTSCPSCSRRSKLLDRRSGNCGVGEFIYCHKLKSFLARLYLSATWCQCKSNKFNLMENISDAASFSCTILMPFSIKLIVRLDCLLSERRDMTCWFSWCGACLPTCTKEEFQWENFSSS